MTRYRAGSIRCACKIGGYFCRASDSLQILERPCAKACRAATQWARGPVGRSIWPPRCRPSGRIDPGARYDPQSNDPPDCGGRRRTRCRTDRTEPEQRIPRPDHGAGDLGVGADSWSTEIHGCVDAALASRPPAHRRIEAEAPSATACIPFAQNSMSRFFGRVVSTGFKTTEPRNSTDHRLGLSLSVAQTNGDQLCWSPDTLDLHWQTD